MGRLQGVILEAVPRRVICLVVAGGGLLTTPATLSLEQVDEWGEDLLHLSLTEMQLKDCPVLPSSSLSTAVLLTEQTKVALDGRREELGKAHRLLMSYPTGEIAFLGVRKGWLLRRELLVPAAWLIEVGPERSLIQASSGQIESLAEYRPDREILLDVRQGIDAYPPFSAGERYAIDVDCQGGMVSLKGNVRFPEAKEEAEAIAWSVRGALGVETDLTSDRELELEIAGALARDPRTRQQRIIVRARLGRVTLEGRLSSQEMKEVAEEIANMSKGVVQLHSSLTVAPPESGAPPEPSLPTPAA